MKFTIWRVRRNVAIPHSATGKMKSMKQLGRRMNSEIPGLVGRGYCVKWCSCWRCCYPGFPKKQQDPSILQFVVLYYFPLPKVSKDKKQTQQYLEEWWQNKICQMTANTNIWNSCGYFLSRDRTSVTLLWTYPEKCCMFLCAMNCDFQGEFLSF